jgi:anaerobic magnesium-protoporphyrin IX monomethyl ester cyclase
MRIALINVSGRLSSDGSRLVSALLKRAGHQVKSIFFARTEPLNYTVDELEQMDDILSQAEVIMVAVYSSYAIRAVQVTEFVHRKYPGKKVFWGGPHCISAPELGLAHADGVCFSEGDQAVVELANKMAAGTNYLTTPNMAFNVGGDRVVNDALPPFRELDSLPYYDYDIEDHFILDGDLVRMTKGKLKEKLAGYPFQVPTLYFLTSRGCPHRCSYCNNTRYVTIFGQNVMRFHSVDRIIEELQDTLERLGFIKFVVFGDDDFLMRPTEEIEDFSEKYKKNVGLPFGIALSAKTYRKEKLEILLDGGLKVIQIGIQSGSQKILDEIYDRNIKVSKAMAVVHQVTPYYDTHDLHVLLDFIIDNPYETRDDVIQTYQFLLCLPIHVRVNIFFLAFFPGTPIYRRALKEGVIAPFSQKAFRFYTRSRVRYQKNYETFLVLLVRHIRRYPRAVRFIPHMTLRALGTHPVRTIASVFPETLYSFLCRMVQ